MKANFSGFLKIKLWSTFQENHSLGFSRKEWDGAQGVGAGTGHGPGALCV